MVQDLDGAFGSEVDAAVAGSGAVGVAPALSSGQTAVSAAGPANLDVVVVEVALAHVGVIFAAVPVLLASRVAPAVFAFTTALVVTRVAIANVTALHNVIVAAIIVFEARSVAPAVPASGAASTGALVVAHALARGIPVDGHGLSIAHVHVNSLEVVEAAVAASHAFGVAPAEVLLLNRLAILVIARTGIHARGRRIGRVATVLRREHGIVHGSSADSDKVRRRSLANGKSGKDGAHGLLDPGSVIEQHNKMGLVDVAIFSQIVGGHARVGTRFGCSSVIRGRSVPVPAHVNTGEDVGLGAGVTSESLRIRVQSFSKLESTVGLGLVVDTAADVATAGTDPDVEIARATAGSAVVRPEAFVFNALLVDVS